MRSELQDRAFEAVYVAQHVSIAMQTSLVHRALGRAFGIDRGSITQGDISQVRARFQALLQRDLENVRRGFYPRRLLFQLPVREYARAAPGLLFELPRVALRRRRAGWRELPGDVSDYPVYFQRTFHWQTDGYFSHRSARLYDVGVEFLFGGTADVMRRQVIPPIVRFTRKRRDETMRILDVGCGTGRTLAQLAEVDPKWSLWGVDLSPYYVEHAREVADRSTRLIAANAESLPFRDGYFDVVTSTYLFHELPRAARRNVVREMLRVLRPGGLLVIEDSAQPFESPELSVFLERFPRDFHEPFFRDYLKDDLGALLTEAGADVESVEPHFVAKVVTATKPEGTRGLREPDPQ